MGTVSVNGSKTCLGCGETISKYSRHDYCDTCRKGPAEPDALDAELAAAEAEFGKKPDPSRPTPKKAAPAPTPTPQPVSQPRNNPSVRLIPVPTLPSKHRGAFAMDAVREFLRGDADICKIEYNQVTANNVQTLFSACIRNNKLGHLVYATSRQGACYLVKVKPEEPLKKGK